MNSLLIVLLVFSLQKSFCVSSPNNNSVWSCLTNLSCINVVIDQVKSGRSVNFGSMKIEKNSNAENEPEQFSNGILSFLKTRSLKMPLGTLIVDISASKEDKNYLEVALLKNDAGSLLFLNSFFYLFYYFYLFNVWLKEGRSGRKRMQMFVPAFMVASQIGWYMLALKLVTTLAIKALLVAKLAFFVAAIITIKKLILEPMHVR